MANTHVLTKLQEAAHTLAIGRLRMYIGEPTIALLELCALTQNAEVVRTYLPNGNSPRFTKGADSRTLSRRLQLVSDV